MIIKKCDFAGCGKAGTCRCPKDRTLSDYWHFCQAHATEYNKNWNFYSGMSPYEMNRQWEKDMFGEGKPNGVDYQTLVGDFLTGRSAPEKSRLPADVVAALSLFGLSESALWPDIQKRYRELAKAEHPDTKKTKDQSQFVEISIAYRRLRGFFGK